MKRIVSYSLAVFMCLGIFPDVGAAGENYALNTYVDISFHNANGEGLSGETHSIRNLTDGNVYSIYQSPVGIAGGAYILDLYERSNINSIYLQELDTAILEFNVYVSNDKSEWKKVYSGKRIGSYGKTIHFPQSRVRYIKLEITKTDNTYNDAVVALTEWQAYNSNAVSFSDLSNMLYAAENKSRSIASEGVQAHYTDTQRKALEDEITKGRGILAKTGATQSEVDAARDNLERMISDYDALAVPQKNDYERLRMQYYNSLTGNLLEKTAAREKTINSQYNTAKGNREKMLKSTSSKQLWADLIPPKANTAQESTKISESFVRLKSMAVAYSQEGNPYYHDSAVLKDIVFGLEYMLATKYNASIPIYSNWYNWKVAAPAAIADILLLLKDDLSSEMKQKLQTSVEFYVDQNFHYTWTGANRLYLSAASLKMGVALENPMYIHRTIYSLAQESKYMDKQIIGSDDNNGYFWDGSYIFHSGFMYNATYGRDQLSNTSNIISMLKGTVWQIEQSTIDDLAKRIIDGYEAIIYKGNTVDVAGGRGFGSGESYGKTIASSIQSISEFLDEPYKTNFLSIAKQFKLDQGLNDALTKDDSVIPRGDIVRLKRYPIGDKLIYASPNHGFGLSMFSNRIKTFEATNGEAMKAWYASSGMTYFLNNDRQQFDRTFWTTVDHYRLPGTTVDKVLRSTTRYEGEMYNPNSWVSSIDYDEKYAAAGMEIANWNSTLQGKKSWFIFDDEIVSIGSDIKGGSETVETTVENRKITGEDEIQIEGKAFNGETTLNGISTAHLKTNGGNIGYYFPQKADLNALRETRTQKEADMWLSDSTKEYTADFFTLWFDHGRQPKNAQYAYVTLMDYSAEDTLAYAQKPNIEIIAQNSGVHAVKNNKLGVTGYNFWTNKTAQAGGVTADGRLNMIVREDDNQIEISMTDPTFAATKPVTVTFDTSVQDILSISPSIKVIGKAPLKIEVDLKNINGKKMILNASKKATGLTAEALSNTSAALIMDINGNNAVSMNIIKAQPQKPLLQNGVAYLPMQWVAQEFKSRYSYSQKTGDYQIIANSVLCVGKDGAVTINKDAFELPYDAVIINENGLYAALPLIEAFYQKTTFYKDGIAVVGTRTPIRESTLDGFVSSIKQWLKDN